MKKSIIILLTLIYSNIYSQEINTELNSLKTYTSTKEHIFFFNEILKSANKTEKEILNKKFKNVKANIINIVVTYYSKLYNASKDLNNFNKDLFFSFTKFELLTREALFSAYTKRELDLDYSNDAYEKNKESIVLSLKHNNINEGEFQTFMKKRTEFIINWINNAEIIHLSVFWQNQRDYFEHTIRREIQFIKPIIIANKYNVHKEDIVQSLLFLKIKQNLLNRVKAWNLYLKWHYKNIVTNYYSYNLRDTHNKFSIDEKINLLLELEKKINKKYPKYIPLESNGAIEFFLNELDGIYISSTEDEAKGYIRIIEKEIFEEEIQKLNADSCSKKLKYNKKLLEMPLIH